MSRVYFSQADSRWANYPYTSKAHPNATIKTSGCGPTSGAMVVSSLVRTAYPNEIAQLFKDNGYRAEEGTALSAFPFLARQFGLKCSQTRIINEAVNCLHRGGMVIASCNAGLFSTGGHIIVLAYMKDDTTITVYDPYLYKGKFDTSSRKGKVTVEGNNVYCNMGVFNTYANCQMYYCYESELRYRSHIQNIGWQEWKNADEVSGTTGQALRMEAIQINSPDIQYRVHMQGYGWGKWCSNNEVAGTTGESRRLEAIEFKSNRNMSAQGHVQNIGWQKEQQGTHIIIGTEGQSLRLEAFKLKFI